MSLFRRCLIATGLMSLGLSGFAADRVGDFALLDHTGKFHQLSYFGDHDVVVILVNGGDSLQTDGSVAALSDLAKGYTGNGQFWVLNPVTDDTRGDVLASLQAVGADLPVLMDESQMVTRSLGVEHFGQVLILTPDSRQVVFRGDIASAAQALGQLTQGASMKAVQTPVSTGPKIPYTNFKQLSYAKDIAPILERNCVSCHHDGAIAPWSMSSHAMVQGWSPMMREVVLTRRMPPGQIDGHVGKAFQNIAGLTITEKQKLIQWIDQGAPRGEGADPLAALEFADPKFTLGEPDIVLNVPPQKIPATGVIDYRYVPVPLNLDRDVWISGMEFVPGDRQVLHHVIAYLSSPADKTSAEEAEDQGENLGGFAPGRQPDSFQDNSGRLIPAGSNLLLQMHYTTSGKETVDATQVGLFLHDEPPAYVMSGGVAGQRRFIIPPGAKEHKLRGEQLIEKDAYLYQMTPHMHFRGKYMSYTAEYPDGSSELLLSVPKYDFNWQFSYRLEQPLFLPAGSKLIAQGAMDNSDRNPGNPDPTRPVFFGLQTMHEMFFGFTTLRYEGNVPKQSQVAGGEPSATDDGGSAGR
jgi:hypothetical protein